MAGTPGPISGTAQGFGLATTQGGDFIRVLKALEVLIQAYGCNNPKLLQYRCLLVAARTLITPYIRAGQLATLAVAQPKHFDDQLSWGLTVGGCGLALTAGLLCKVRFLALEGLIDSAYVEKTEKILNDYFSGYGNGLACFGGLYRGGRQLWHSRETKENHLALKSILGGLKYGLRALKYHLPCEQAMRLTLLSEVGLGLGGQTVYGGWIKLYY